MSSPACDNFDDSIPLVDDEPEEPTNPLVDLDSSSLNSDPNTISSLTRIFDTLPSTFSNESLSCAGQESLDPDISPDEHEEKARLITQVLELQNTLDDLSQRVDSVKEENLKLRSENQVLGQYIESLMSASSVFQPTSPKNKKK